MGLDAVERVFRSQLERLKGQECFQNQWPQAVRDGLELEILEGVFAEKEGQCDCKYDEKTASRVENLEKLKLRLK